MPEPISAISSAIKLISLGGIAGYGLAIAIVNESPTLAELIPQHKDNLLLTLVLALGVHYINRNTPDKKESQEGHKTLLTKLENFALDFHNESRYSRSHSLEVAKTLGRVEQKVDDVVKRVDKIEKLGNTGEFKL